MNKKQQARQERLLPAGIPRYVRCYDNGESADHITVVYSGRYNKGRNLGSPHYFVGMSAEPFHPLGICQHDEAQWKCIDVDKWGFAPAMGRKGHLGTRVSFESLPEDCKKVVLADYKEIWGLT